MSKTMSMGGFIESRMKASWKVLEDWQSTMYSMMVFGATMVVMFWASVFLYTSFYFTYMPQESITWPIHLQYKSCGEMPGICSSPNSLVSVTDPSRGSLLARGQKYRVVIDLEMPESPTNQKSGTELTHMSGMFLIIMEMRSFTGDVLRKASRSSMLRYKSPLLQAMSTFIFAPFLLYGAHEEKQLVTAELFSQYEEDPVTPLSDVYIEIGSRNIEVYSAQLRIHATFAGLRHFMFYYPVTAAVFGIGVCMVFLSLIVLFSWYQFSMPAEKMTLSPGGHPNGHISVEDISKEDFEKDAKEGTDDSRCTSSASETSYSPAQMENDTNVEGSGWASLFTRKPSSTNDDARENNSSRRTSSHNVASYVARRKSSTNVSRSSSRRSSARNDDTIQETPKRRPSFYESIVGALSTPENTKDDIQNITLEVPPVRSRHSSVGSTKDDSTSKRSSWIFGGDSDKETPSDQSSWLFGSDVKEKKESATTDENTKKELESRKSSWRSSWFGGDSETADTDDKPENEKYTSSKHSSHRSSLCSDETQEELLQHTEDFTDKGTSTSKRSSWRSSWFGGELQDDQAGQLEETDSKKEDNNVRDADEDISSIEDDSLKKSAGERKPSFIESMFGISINVEQANNLSRRSSTRDDIVDNAQELEENYSQQSLVSAPQEDVLEVSKSRASSRRSSVGSFKSNKENQEFSSMPDSSHISTDLGDDLEALEILPRERKPSFVESMMEMLISPKDTSSRRSSTGKEIDNVLEVSDSNSRRSSRGLTRDDISHESYNENAESQLHDTRRSSRRSSRGSTREDALEIHISTDLGDDLEATTSVDRSSPIGRRTSSTLVDSLENLPRERKPSFVESMMEMLSPKDTSSRRSSTGKEIDNVLEVSDSNSRRSSRGLTSDIISHESYNENGESQLHDTRRSSRRSSRVSTREDALEIPINKTGSRRSSIGSLRVDTSEVSGRRSPRDVAIDDAAKLLEDANLVVRRKSSIKDSSIKRVSYLLDEGSNGTRRRSSTEGYLYPSTDDASTRRKSSTSFIQQLLTEPSDKDEVKIQKSSRSSSRDESLQRKSSTTPLSLDVTGEEFTVKHSRSPSISTDKSEVVRKLSQSSSPVTKEHEETHSEDQPRPLSGRLSYLFQESETENLAPPSGVTAERRPSFIESMMGILVGGGGTTAQDESDNKEDEKE